MSDLSELRAFAESLADLAKTETLPRFRAGLVADNKWDEGFDPVTDADREAERVIRAAIEARFPDHGILGEEHGEKASGSPWRWVLDPVDGTRAFICGVPTWATLIALEEDGEPVIGVIDQPYTQERWVGDGERTELVRPDGRRVVRTSGLEDLSRARLSTTDPRPEGYFTADEAAAFAAVAAQARLPRFGYDAYAYGLLACGELDAVAESFLQRYDYAALLPVIRGAGGVVTNWRGGPLSASARGQLVAAASPALHESIVQLLTPAADG